MPAMARPGNLGFPTSPPVDDTQSVRAPLLLTGQRLPQPRPEGKSKTASKATDTRGHSPSREQSTRSTLLLSIWLALRTRRPACDTQSLTRPKHRLASPTARVIA